MAEGGIGAHPQVFVVDSQASYIPLPSRRPLRWGGFRRRLPPFLMGLVLCLLAVQSGCIYYLFKRTEALQGTASSQEDGSVLHRLGSEETNEITVLDGTRPPVRHQQASAHLMGSSQVPVKDVVQWDTAGEAHIQAMDYKDGRLVVKEEGYYYVYSKVNFKVDCSLFKHKVMRLYKGYKIPQELMTSNRLQCFGNKEGLEEDNLRNSYLGGVFLLNEGDAIFVTVEKGTLLKLGSAGNFLGAFRVY